MASGQGCEWWEKLNEHLQDVDEALLERHLRSRLIHTLGSARRLYLLEAAVFISIIVIVALTALELTLPLPARVITWISISDTIISLFLITEFFLRLSLAEDKGWYFRRYWIDLLASIPFHQVLSFGPLVPVARFARLLRLGRAVRRLLSLLHIVLPESLGRFYLYNRVPMTLAHHAAMAFYAADLAEQTVNPL